MNSDAVLDIAALSALAVLTLVASAFMIVVRLATMALRRRSRPAEGIAAASPATTRDVVGGPAFRAA